jgi:hypothetical protein
MATVLYDCGVDSRPYSSKIGKSTNTAKPVAPIEENFVKRSAARG